MKEEIKNCPFCGSPAEIMCIPHCKNPYVVICGNISCQASLGVYSKSRLAAIKSWNERIEEKEIEQLKKENK